MSEYSMVFETFFVTQGPVTAHIKFCSNLFPSCIILRRIVHTLTLRTIVQEIYSYLKKKAVRNQVDDSQPISTLHRIEPCFKVSIALKQGVQSDFTFIEL